MKNGMICVVVCMLAVFAASTVRAADEAIELKLNLQEGQSYTLIVTMEQDVTQWIQGNESDMTQTIALGETLTVTDVDEQGVMTVDITFGPIYTKVEGPQGSFEYDSEQPPEEVPAPAKGLASLFGGKFTVKLTPEGKVIEITGVDAMFDAMAESLDDLQGPMRDKMIEDMKKQFGDEGLKEMLENAIGFYPDTPVAVGDSWTQAMTLKRGFPMIMENVYTLTDREDGVATIGIKSTVKPNPDAEPMHMGPMSMMIELRGTQEGSYEIDTATGWFLRGDVTQEMEGEVTMSNIPNQEEDMSIPMRIESTITFETE